MLTEEIAKPTQLRLEVSNSKPAGGCAVITLETSAGAPADGYSVKASSNSVMITGNDPRGTLFGAGYLLRHLRMERQVLTVRRQSANLHLPALSVARPPAWLPVQGQCLRWLDARAIRLINWPGGDSDYLHQWTNGELCVGLGFAAGGQD